MACYLANIWQLTTAPKPQPDTYQAVLKLFMWQPDTYQAVLKLLCGSSENPLLMVNRSKKIDPVSRLREHLI